MKKTILTTALTMAMAVSAQAATLPFSSDAIVDSGEVFSVDLMVSDLENKNLAAYDADSMSLLDFDYVEIVDHNDMEITDPTLISGAIPVNDVPLPDAVWLLGSSLVGLVGMKRKKLA